MKEELRPVPLEGRVKDAKSAVEIRREIAAHKKDMKANGLRIMSFMNRQEPEQRRANEQLFRLKAELERAEKEENAAKDHVTLLPVPDGTSELQYTARDLGKHAFERDGDNSTCKICGERLAADIHRSGGKLIPVVGTLQKKRCAKCGGKGVVRGGFGGGSWVSCPVCTAEAKDSVSSAALLGALIAAIAWLYRPRETVAPSDYDLRSYQPRRRDW